MNSQCAVLPHELIGHVSGVRSAFGEEAMFFPRKRKVAPGRFELGCRITCPFLMDVEGMLSRRQSLDLRLNQHSLRRLQ